VRISVIALTPLLSGLMWSAALVVDPGPLAPGSVLLVGVGLIGTAAVGGAGLMLSPGRWSKLTTAAAAVIGVAVAVVRPLDMWWVAALLATGLSVVVLFTSATTRVAQRPAPMSGVPPRAVLLPLVLIGFPAVLGLAAWDDPSWGTLAAGLTAPVAALWYARVFPGGLVVARVAWPLLAIGLSITQPPMPAWVSAAGGALVATIAWHPSVKLAFHPPREVGTRYSIPPELAPREVLDAANLDEGGNPRE
jgi:hypothetical protein